MYGQGDVLAEERESHRKAVELLLDVATGEKTTDDVRAYLEENYPKLCVEDAPHTEPKKKW